MNKSINTEIIAVGTELLLGQIANTNAQWMSQQLALHGMNTYFHTVVGDNLQRLTTILNESLKRSDVIIVSGGLGPTKDDLSREAFAEISNIPIVEEPNSLRKIEHFFEKQQMVMTPNNRLQARVFQNSIVLTNRWGMAPGNIVEYNNKKIIFIPGVPREMKQIFSDHVIPFLKGLNGEMIIQSLVLKFVGIGESNLEHELQELITYQQNPTIAPLSHKDGVTIRVTAKAQTMDEAKRMLERTKADILKQVGTFYYGENDETIEQKVFERLKNDGKTISAAESLTGGAFQDKMVNVEGTSLVFKGGIVSYDVNIKRKILGVSHNLIANDGTVSASCARAMAQGIMHLMDTDIGISFTGVAGPEEIENKQVGTVFIAVIDRSGYENIQRFQFHGDRKQIRHRAVIKGYELLLHYLK